MTDAPGEASEIIRPAAILSEASAREILQELENAHVARGGVWRATPGLWERWDAEWVSPVDPGESELIGTLSCIYDQPTKYAITVFRAAVSSAGAAAGWTVESLCDDAFQYAGLTLASCPRAEITPPPPTFKMR